jgi:hypothetical protein
MPGEPKELVGNVFPSTSTRVFSDQVWRHAVERTTSLHGWKSAAAGTVLVASVTVVVTKIRSGPGEARTALLISVLTAALTVMLVLAELSYRLWRARGDILAERLERTAAAAEDLEASNINLARELATARASGDRLRGTILTVMSGQRAGDGATVVSFEMSIDNLGPLPTIVPTPSWRVEIILPTGRSADPILFHVGGSVTLSGATGSRIYTRDNLLYEKTASSPIGVGARVSGVLYASIQGVSPEEVLVAGTVYRIFFQDITGVEFVAEYNRRGHCNYASRALPTWNLNRCFGRPLLAH